jgi:hypothetical protein
VCASSASVVLALLLLTMHSPALQRGSLASTAPESGLLGKASSVYI